MILDSKNKLRSAVQRYAFAVAVVVCAWILTWSVAQFATKIPLALFFVAVMLATLYGGRGPGLVATFLSVSGAYFYRGTPFHLLVGLEGGLPLAVVVIVTLLIGSLTERIRRAELSAALNERRLVATIKSIGDAFITTDADCRIDFMNAAADRLTGWREAAARGKLLDDVVEIVDEKTGTPLKFQLSRVIRGGETILHTSRASLRTRDGNLIPVNCSCSPIKSDDGVVVGAALVIQDTTADREADEIQHRLASIVESSDDAILSTTLDAVITSWNRGAERLYGYSASEAIGRLATFTVPDDQLDEVLGLRESILTGETVSHFETKRVRKDGVRIDVALTVSPIFDSSGCVVGASAIVRDTSRRKRAEHALRESEERFRTMADKAPVLIWMCDANNYRNYHNETWLKFTGRTFEQQLGDGWVEVVHPDDTGRLFREFLAAFDRRASFEIEYRIRRFDGVYRWILDSGVPRFTSEDTFAGYIGSCLDITERKQVEEERSRLLAGEHAARVEAERANRTKDEFLATLSHELRTPLTAMLGWTRMLRTKELDAATAEHAIETIERNACVQAQLVEDLLDVSRIITGKLRIDPSPVDLIPVIEAALDSVRPAAAAKGIDLHADFDTQAGPVFGDPGRLQQVVWNLLSNAVKFTPRGGRVNVELRRRDYNVEVSVTDTGPGVPPDFLQYVFDRFSQADSSTTRVHGGLGLGLAIARHLVELHGGTISVESIGDGQGAAFGFRLPLLAVLPFKVDSNLIPSGALQSGERNTNSLVGLNVLLVDDDPDARDLLTAVLERHGASVISVATSIEAIETYERTRPDVIVSDIGLPGEDGYELIRKVRLRGNDNSPVTPAVALTAYATEYDRSRALDAGYQIHLAKPVDPMVFVETITELAGREKRA